MARWMLQLVSADVVCGKAGVFNVTSDSNDVEIEPD